MYNRRYRKCCCQKHYDNNVIETACNNCGITADYYTKKVDEACDCGFEESENVFPSNPMFGQSYVPFQTMNETYMPCSGLEKGTIFPELVSEYCPGQSMEEIQYIADTNMIKEGCNR